MSDEHFGTSLRLGREKRALTMGDVSLATKLPRSTLEQLEAGDLSALPAAVFVRGFIRAYARTVGIDELGPLSHYDRAVRARSQAEHAEAVLPIVDPRMAGIAARRASDLDVDVDLDMDVDAGSSRRNLGLAVFVIVLLLIATITLSLLLRRPPPSGEGLSQKATPGQRVDQPTTVASDTAPGAAAHPDA
jgi:hypothetical protein